MTPLVNRLLQRWRSDPAIAENIACWLTLPERSARWADFPDTLHPRLRQALQKSGLQRLYSHQAQCWDSAQAGHNLVIVTGTASGKTLCYNFSILDAFLKDPQTSALYLFPTKALTNDQRQSLLSLISAIVQDENPPEQAAINIPLSIYDGDTPRHERSRLRSRPGLLLTNPDMLHMGILPHHTLWAEYFRHLRFVVIDEIHIYRGVFGSHVANLIRRLKRISRFYGAFPQFILTSATIANPDELARRIIEAPVEVIDDDGSPRGERHFLLYNPPMVQKELGIRKSAGAESIRLAGDLLSYNLQTILFARARHSVELLLKNLQFQQPDIADQLHGYRSGYLPGERRAIEQQLRTGAARAVVATNALELGVDIGGMNAAILVGYPGTIAATLQQAGRAGRRSEASLAVLVASAGPLDQFLVQHPEYLFERSPEKALINPDNLLILLQHLRCAAFELPFSSEESFGNLPQALLKELLALLEHAGYLHAANGRHYWVAENYPADQVSLRSTSAQPVVLQAFIDGQWETIGEVDESSASWMVHPNAIYLHAGKMYQVEALDDQRHLAQLSPVQVDYYTETRSQIDIEKVSIQEQRQIIGGQKVYGEIQVTSRVIGYRRVRWFSHETLGEYPLEMPPSQLRTTAYWLCLDQTIVDGLRREGLWKNDPNDYGPNWTRQRNLARQRDQYTCQVCGQVEKGQAHHVHHKVPFRSFSSPEQANRLENLITLCPVCHQKAEIAMRMRSGLAGLGYVLHHISPLFLMCDAGDLGVHTHPSSPLADGQPVVVLYDQIPAGIGLSESLFHQHEELLSRSLELIEHCPCLDGCPGCVGPSGENGIGGKKETLAILKVLTGN